MARLVAFVLVIVVAVSGCTVPQPAADAKAESAERFTTGFVDREIRGDLALRLQVLPAADETCVYIVKGETVRRGADMTLFAVMEGKNGATAYETYAAIVTDAGAAGAKASDVAGEELRETFQVRAKFSEKKWDAVTVFVHNLQSASRAFEVSLTCPSEPQSIAWSAGRALRLLDEGRASLAYVAAPLCPDLIVSGGGGTQLNVPHDMRMWFNSAASTGTLELQGPQGTKTWDLSQRHEAAAASGPAGSYAVNLRRIGAATTSTSDTPHLAGAIGSFTPIDGLEDLNDIEARAATAGNAQMMDGTACAQ